MIAKKITHLKDLHLALNQWTDGPKQLLITNKSIFFRDNLVKTLIFTDEQLIIRYVMVHPYKIGTFFVAVSNESFDNLRKQRPELDIRQIG